VGVGCASAATPFWPSWTQLTQEGYGVAASSSDPSVILAVTTTGASVRSSDGGKTFTPVTGVPIVPNPGIPGASGGPTQFYAAPGSAKTFFASSAPPWVGTVPPQISRSDDAGVTWRVLPAAPLAISGSYDGYIGSIVVGSNPDTLYGVKTSPTVCFTGLCAYQGFDPYVSTDSGTSWHSIAAGLPGIGSNEDGLSSIVAPAISSGGRTIYAWTPGGISRSLDAGATWVLVRTAPKVREIAVDQVDASTLYFWAGTDPQLYVTEDAGATWRAAAPLDAGSPGNYSHLLTDPLVAGRVFYVARDGRVFESVDRARSWKRVAAAHDQAEGVLLIDVYPVAISVSGDSRILLANSAPNFSPKYIYRMEIHPDSYVLGSDLWWNPAESGRGMTITQHSDGKVFVAWFAYDTQGKQAWRVMPEGEWQDAKTLSGKLYQTQGPAYFAGSSFDPSRVSVQAVGSASVQFADDSNATFTYEVNDGSHGTTSIQREPFGSVDRKLDTGSDVSDLWWNPGESGWGVVLSQQYGSLFAAWYVYDASGHPQWLVLPESSFKFDAANGNAPTYTGEVYVTSGPPSTGPFDPATVTATPVGTASFAFTDRDNATLSYNVFGQTATRPITRQRF
jgi:hypothetical protein